jgi:hypothetical protein
MARPFQLSNAPAPDAAAAVPLSPSFFSSECAQYMPSQTDFFFSEEKATACRFVLPRPRPDPRQSLPSLLPVTVPCTARQRRSDPATCSLSRLCRFSYPSSRPHASATLRGQVRVSGLRLADPLLGGTLEGRYGASKVL